MSGRKLLEVFASLAKRWGLLGKRRSAELKPVPGTRVYLTPPPGFVDAPNFSGFINPQEQASIMINEIPGPFGEISRGLDPVNLASRGMKLLSKESVEIGETNGLMLNLQQKHLNEMHNKWLAVFGNSHETVMITATFPAKNTKISDVLKEHIVQVRWDTEVMIDPLADLSFTITPPAGMLLAHRQHMTLLYTADGKLNHKSSRDPLFVIGQSVGESSSTDLSSFARQRLLQSSGYYDIEIKRERDLTIDGLPAYEIDADATDYRQGDPVAIYQTIIMPPGDKLYFIAQGIVHREIALTYFPAFESTVASFQLR